MKISEMSLKKIDIACSSMTDLCDGCCSRLHYTLQSLIILCPPTHFVPTCFSKLTLRASISFWSSILCWILASLLGTSSNWKFKSECKVKIKSLFRFSVCEEILDLLQSLLNLGIKAVKCSRFPNCSPFDFTYRGRKGIHSEFIQSHIKH